MSKTYCVQTKLNKYFLLYVIILFFFYSCSHKPDVRKRLSLDKIIYYKENLYNKDILYKFYENDELIWSNNHLEQIEKLPELIIGNGLNEAGYRFFELKKGFFAEDKLIQAQADILVTDRLISLIKHLKYGAIHPSRVDVNWRGIKRAELQFEEIKNLKNEKNIVKFVKDFSPINPSYLRLKNILVKEIKKPMPNLSLLRAIRVNMERWRWLNTNLGQNYIIVNIANSKLSLVLEKKDVLDSKIIIGTVYRQKPVFSSQIEKIILNPFWRVPPTILKEDLMPKIKSSEQFLKSQGMEAFQKSDDKLVEIAWKDLINLRSDDLNNIVIIQSPSRYNPLGKYKFYFQNPLGVYLHDTNNPSVFEGDETALSSGCIRVENAKELADILLENLGGGEVKDSEYNSFVTKIIKLKKTIPVHIVYFTLWVNVNGKLFEVNDIYGQDQKLFEMLETNYF